MPTDISKSFCVIRWLVNIPNHRTQRIYLYSLNKFVDFLNRDPDKIIDLGRNDPEEAHNLLKIFYNSLSLASTTKMTIYQALLSISQVDNIVRSLDVRRGIQQQFGKRYLFHPHGFRRYWKHQLRMGA